MALDVMILMRAISIYEALKGVGPEIENFLGPLKEVIVNK
jgi:hypothetical protein